MESWITGKHETGCSGRQRLHLSIFVLPLMLAVITNGVLAEDDSQDARQRDANELFSSRLEESSTDTFTSSLSSLQNRIQSLEEQNTRLEAQLQAYQKNGTPDSEHEKPVGQDDKDQLKSFEELLKFSTETEERLKKLENGIEKDKEAAKKKKEEDAKKAKKWFEKYTIRG